jgi:hypothetical protein
LDAFHQRNLSNSIHLFPLSLQHLAPPRQSPSFSRTITAFYSCAHCKATPFLL